MKYNILSYDRWVVITDRGASGDQVQDILASWKADRDKLRAALEQINSYNFYASEKMLADDIRHLQMIADKALR